MPLRSFLLAILCLAASAVGARGQELPRDKSVAQVTLDNGLRLAIQHNPDPPGAARAVLIIGAGSRGEGKNQHGAAHVAAHLLLTDDQADGLGITGAMPHSAVHVDRDRTIVRLDIRHADGPGLGALMDAVRSVLERRPASREAFGLARREALEELKEFGGAMEWRTRLLERLPGGGALAQAPAWGTAASISSLEYEAFESFRSAACVPANVLLVVVGDVPVDRVLAQARTRLSDLPAGDPVPIEPLAAGSPTGQGVLIEPSGVFEVAEVSLVWAGPGEGPVRTEVDAREGVLDELARDVVRVRLEDVARSTQTVMRVDAGVEPAADRYSIWSVGVLGDPGAWRVLTQDLFGVVSSFSSTPVGETERNRAVDRVRAGWRADQERGGRSDQLAERLAGLLVCGSTLVSREQEYRLRWRLSAGITASEIDARLAARYPASSALLHIRAPESWSGEISSKSALSLVRDLAAGIGPAMVAHSLEAVAELPAEELAYGRAGRHAGSGVWWGGLSNGVIVRYRAGRPDRVRVSVTFAMGEMSEQGDQRGVTILAAGAWRRPALLGVTAERFTRLLREGGLSVDASVAADAVRLDIEGPPGKATQVFGVARRLVGEAVFEPSTFESARADLLERATRGHDAQAQALFDAVWSALVEPVWGRLGAIDPQRATAITRVAAENRLSEIVTRAPVRVTIVGGVDRDEAFRLAARAMHDLPPRSDADPYAGLRDPPRRGEGRRVVSRANEAGDRAIAVVGFGGCRRADTDDAAALDVAASVLRTRLSGALSARAPGVIVHGVISEPTRATTTLGTVYALLSGEPGGIDDAVSEFERQARFLRDQGPTPDELARARAQCASAADMRWAGDNAWAELLASPWLERGELDAASRAGRGYDAIDARRLGDVLQRYARDETFFSAIVKPE